jgi:hypothetical protein
MNNQKTNCEAGQQPALLRALSVQNDIFKDTENTFESIYSLINRFENVAIRLESTTFPKPDPGCIDGSAKSGDIPTRPDGVLGQIVNINEADARQLSELNHNIIPKLMVVLEHLERHI